jgi:hypothetical protein
MKDPLQIEFSCPVPLEQQPCNEYEELKESGFFSWVQLEIWDYTKRLVFLSFWGWLLIGPIAGASFPPQKKPLYFLLAGTIGVTICVGLVVLRLYLGWFYISDRLKAEKVFYEESGWYDGQVWQKPEAVLTRDRLIVAYQIEPIMKRLQKTAGILISIIGGSSSLWLIVAKLSSKP